MDTAQHFASSSNTAGPCFHSCKRKTCTAEECVIRFLRHALPISLLILRKKLTVLQSKSLPGLAILHITIHLRLELTPVEEMILWTAGGTLRSKLT